MLAGYWTNDVYGWWFPAKVVKIGRIPLHVIHFTRTSACKGPADLPKAGGIPERGLAALF